MTVFVVEKEIFDTLHLILELIHHVFGVVIVLTISNEAFLEVLATVVSGLNLHLKHLVLHVFEFIDLALILSVNLTLELFFLNSLLLFKLLLSQSDCFFSFVAFVFGRVVRIEHLRILSKDQRLVFTFTSEHSSRVVNKSLYISNGLVQLIIAGGGVITDLVAEFVFDLGAVLAVPDRSESLDFF